MDDLVSNQKISGASIAVEKNGEWILTPNYGFADLESNKSISFSTQFNIMTITKIFVACGVIQLADKKEINLDVAITKYLTELHLQYNNVKVYQLLNHIAGVPDYVHVKGYMEQADQTQCPWQVLNPIIKGEKINLESRVRRYKIKFKKGEINWVIIFSNENKIIITNHM